VEAFLVSAGIVALAEIGGQDSAARARPRGALPAPGSVILGIFVATLANHALAAWLGAGVAAALGPEMLRWILGLSFLAHSGWTLVPDKPEKEKMQSARLGAFAATLLAFFLVEMGDKTQIATVALARAMLRSRAVVAGTTLA